MMGARNPVNNKIGIFDIMEVPEEHSIDDDDDDDIKT